MKCSAVSGDLLRYLSGPIPYSPWWILAAAALLAVIVGWYVGVVVWTLPPDRLRRMPLIRSLHSRLIRRRFSRSIRTSGEHYQAGRLSATEAATAMSRTLRSFLAVTSGSRIQYMHVGEIAAGDLAPAATVISALNDARFNTTSGVDLTRTAQEAEELIRSWS